ncbi:hypothetical protein K431DRAFT_305472 [Polychaeton citri CBS 116435]|uniref:Ankyrin n=1 Tax=Polychaeton citri CBS 116435 TaxID=1314669 RepID=A0A9P4Q3T4_9PEZI|nr:hypothetical protein K431DRAFT_305472 [Polychaeton citri CBS 116435]
MSGFGFSVSDIVTGVKCIHASYKVYVAYKHAGNDDGRFKAATAFYNDSAQVISKLTQHVMGISEADDRQAATGMLASLEAPMRELKDYLSRFECIVENKSTSIRCTTKQRLRKLLRVCFSWIGEGPHMELLEDLLSMGMEPTAVHPQLFTGWPGLSSPGWISECNTEDPFGIDFIRRCLRVSSGSFGCDSLMEKLLGATTGDFEAAITSTYNSNALGQSALHLAVIFPDRLLRLLQAGWDPDLPDTKITTPLMYAASYGCSEAVIYLLEHGADPSIRDNRNQRNFWDYAI